MKNNINAKIISRRGLNTSASTPDIHEASATINPYIAITLPACESLYPSPTIYLDKNTCSNLSITCHKYSYHYITPINTLGNPKN